MEKSLQETIDKFQAISAIPRESGNETAIRKFIIQWSKQRRFKIKTDKTGNLLVVTGKRPVILQGHLDMVCEKNSNSKHDFKKDPIKIINKNGWLAADGTTLADNGIALAYMMQLAQEGFKGELLFTVEEETGLIGASHLPKNWLTGKYLINLDSEDEGIFTIGCAGGIDIEATARIKTIKNSLKYADKISINDLPGGHSGVDINKNIPNAIKVLTARLSSLTDIRIAQITGGSKRNAIPRDAYAVIVSNKKLKLPPAHRPGRSFDDQQSKKIIDLLKILPHGPIKMWNKTIPHTSCNLAIINTGSDQISVTVSCRSFSQRDNTASVEKIKKIFRRYGFALKQLPGYPPWEPESADSRLITTAVKTYKKLFKKAPKTLPMHAGLECGVIKNKYPHLEAISLGPNIKNPHSPDEKIEIKSIKNTWELLQHMTKKLSAIKISRP